MADHLTLRTLTNKDRSFYQIMGPYLARRNIVKDLGGHIWDDDNKTWYVALNGRQVVGFCAARDDGKTVAFQSAYTLPDHRKQGVYRMLFLARLADHPGRRVRCVATEATLPVLLAHGFTPVRNRGRYTEVTRNAS
jgi:GNAT superfamily N-acetyltransferase